MSIRTGMFVVMLALMPAWGCSQRYVLRMSNPEQSSTVTLYEGGREDTDDDDRTTVLDEQDRIAKVAAFFKAKADEFYPLAGESTRMPRCTIVFRKDREEGDRFWLDPSHVYMQTPTGEYFACKLTTRERAELVNIFRFTTNFKSSE